MKQTEFTEEKWQELCPEGYENYFWIIARNKIIHERLLKLGIKNQKILDLGCGPGATVDYLYKHNFNCYGSELSEAKLLPSIVERVYNHQDFKTLPEDFRNEVEVVLLLDVMEHLPNPTEFLIDVKKYLPKLKYLISTVPARQELWNRHDELNDHFRRYTIESLKKEIESANFNILDVKYFFHSLYPVIYLRNKLVKDTKLKRSPKYTKSLFHQTVAEFFRLEEKFFPSEVPGSSVLATAVYSEKH